MPYLANLASDSHTRTLQLLEAIGRSLGLLPPLPQDEPPMGTVTKSIGTTGRDYSTITAWEADLDNAGVYAAGDYAVGEAYNDSAFNESVTINGGGTVGLASVKLTVPESERHDGTAGMGARIVRSSISGTSILSSQRNNLTVEWLELTASAKKTSGDTFVGYTSGNYSTNTHHLLIHDFDSSTNYAISGLSVTGTTPVSHNNIVYDVKKSGGTAGNATGITQDGDSAEFYNSTVFNMTSTSGNGVGISYNYTTVKNCIAMGAGTSDFSGSNGTQSNNMSSDDTAPGTGSIGADDGVLTANQFVSTVDGSEDLHLKTGADAIDVGTDLGTTPAGVNYDIDNRDRDAQGDTWDIGADEFVAAGGESIIQLPTLAMTI